MNIKLIKSNKMEPTKMIMSSFVLFLVILMPILKLDMVPMFSNVLVRIGMNGVLVLSMFPSIICGVGVNYGLTVGIVCGLLGGVCTLEWGMTGWSGIFVAILIGIASSAFLGYLYSLLLNKVKGSEGIIATYIGFAVVSFFCILWQVLPFNNGAIRWPQGNGVRNVVALTDNYEKIMDQFLAIKIGNFVVPTGALLFFALCCYLVYIFSKTKTGIIMKMVGQNAKFAVSCGIDVDKYRTLGVVLSSIFGAIGILVYSQSYGFYSLYAAPQKMAFPAIAAVLIGGANNHKVTISNVIIGLILYQCMVTFSLPIANAVLPNGNFSEVVRMIVSNGVILLALVKEAKR